MTIQQLKYVIAISEMGSLNKASEILYVSQPSLSSSIHELERELGITIFNRTGQGTTLTGDGMEFIQNARQLVQEYDGLMDKYGKGAAIKKKFGISTQHYSFAVKSFVDIVSRSDTTEYEFAIRETSTGRVIDDVSSGRSEIGILYLCDFNRKAIEKHLKSNGLEFHHLIDCNVYVYIWNGHPLADREFITFEDLSEYPCLSFEQGESASLYFAEEILSDREYPRTIKANDRATMLNLMRGLNGYTLCSGIICEELNGSDYVAVPFSTDVNPSEGKMEIGYITRKNLILTDLAVQYIKELQAYLKDL